MCKAVSIFGFVVTVVLGVSAPAHADTITYANRLTFQAALGTSITDNYSAAGYEHGDLSDLLNQDTFSNAAMSAVLGETDYQTTRIGSQQLNYVMHEAANDYYCTGCNGSFRLLFSTTSVGTASGVYGAGFNFINAPSTTPLYHAFVTFGNGTTTDYALPFVASAPGVPFAGFFGITSDLQISSIHLGLANGQTTFEGSFAIDNLTIGSQAGAQSVPDAGSSLALLMPGLIGLAYAKRHLSTWV